MFSSTTTSLADIPLPTLRTAVVSATSVVLAVSVYFVYSRSHSLKPPDGGLHRSGAVRHRRPRGQTLDDLPDPSDVLTLADLDLQRMESLDGAPPDTGTDNDAEQVARNNGQDSLLKQLTFEIAAQREINEGVVHRGINCDGCQTTPIRGVRYRCANCEDFDLCENCEATVDHMRTHVFYKIRVPRFWWPEKVVPVAYPGRPLEMPKEPPRELIERVRTQLSVVGQGEEIMSEYEIRGLYVHFTCLADEPLSSSTSMGIPWGISPRAFRHLLPVTNRGSLILSRLFAAFDASRNNLISFADFVAGAHLQQSPRRTRIWRERIFRMFDIDDDGFITRHHLLHLYQSLREIDEDITLHVLRTEYSSEDHRRLDDNRTSRDFIDGSQPLPNYFTQYEILHHHRQGPDIGFGQLRHGVSSRLGDGPGGTTLPDLRDSSAHCMPSPPDTPASRFISRIQTKTFNTTLDPLFLPIEARAHRIVISYPFRQTYQPELDLFRRYKKDQICKVEATLTKSLFFETPTWSGMALHLNTSLDTFIQEFMSLLDAQPRSDVWWDAFATRAIELAHAFAHPTPHAPLEPFPALLQTMDEATVYPQHRHRTRPIRPDLVFWLLDELQVYDSAGDDVDEKKLARLDFGNFWAAVERAAGRGELTGVEVLGGMVGVVVI